MGSATRSRHAGPAGGGPLARRGAGTVVVAALTFGLLAVVAPGQAVAAPGDAAIAAARAGADEVSARIGALAEQLSAAEGQVAAARAAAAIALDEYQATQAEYESAQTRSTDAAAAAEQALVDLGIARGHVVDFARSSYMDGSSYAGAAALITSRSPSEFIERSALLEAAGAHRTDVLGRVSVLQDRAARADSKARTALAEAKTLKQKASAELKVAAESETSARSQAAQLTVRKTELDAELTAAQDQLAHLVGAQEAELRARAQKAKVAQAQADEAARQEKAREEEQKKQQNQPAPPPVPRAPSHPDPTPAGAGSASAAATAVAAAMNHLGLSYAWGGGGSGGPGWGWGPDDGVWGFDCSGLTQYAYAQAGIGIPRNSRAQYSALPKVSSNDLRAGDLVFWATIPSNPDTIHHVAIYLGNGTVLHAPQSGDVVKISTMWWGEYAGAVRPSA